MSFQPIHFMDLNLNIPHKMMIYSPYNSGSNLFEKLIKSLFTSIDYHMDKLPWKHKVIDVQYIPDRLHVFIMKQPFSWFLSFIKSPYEFKWDHKQNIFSNIPIKLQPHWNCRSPVVFFDNIYDTWITYYQKYQEFIKLHNHQNCIFITYEDLLYRTEDVFIYLSQLWKIDLPENYKEIIKEIMKKPAKNHGLCNDLEKALNANQFNFLKEKYKKDSPNAIYDFFNHLKTKNVTIHPHHQDVWLFKEWNELSAELLQSNLDEENNSLR